MRYQFGDFELATERYELRRNGIVLHVEPLVFDLILFLLRHAGRVVNRDEIVEGVWQGRLVSEATIDGCIKLARRILGDSGDNQSYIRTVRGRGFEFAAPVTARDQGQSSVNSSKNQTQEDLIGSRAPRGKELSRTRLRSQAIHPAPMFPLLERRRGRCWRFSLLQIRARRRTTTLPTG